MRPDEWVGLALVLAAVASVAFELAARAVRHAVERLG